MGNTITNTSFLPATTTILVNSPPEEAITGLVKPLAESLKTFDEHVRTLETTRQQAYTSLELNLKGLTESQEKL